MDLEAANKDRDRRLRRRLLEVLNLATDSPTGGMSAVMLVNEVERFDFRPEKFVNEGHAIRLVRELKNKKMVTEKQFPRRPTETFGLRHMHLAITAGGTALLNENVPADPDIEDKRIMPEAF